MSDVRRQAVEHPIVRLREIPAVHIGLGEANEYHQLPRSLLARGREHRTHEIRIDGGGIHLRITLPGRVVRSAAEL